MEIDPGYRRTEVGVIPEDWQVRALKSMGTVIRGASPRPKGDKRYYGGDIPRLMVEDVTRDGKFVTPRVDFLTEQGAELSRPCKKGTLTIVCSGTVGIPSFLAVDACIHDGFLALVDVDERVSDDYLYHQLAALRNRFESSATHGGVFTNLTTSILQDFGVPLPPTKDEQRAIAAALNDMDALIAALDHLIAKKRAIKRGAMQQLLTGKTRLPGFSGAWQIRTFAECFDFLPTGSNSRSELSKVGDTGYIHYGDIHTKWSLVLDCAKDSIPSIQEEKVRNLPTLKNGDLVIADASEDYEGLGASVEIKNVDGREIVSGLHTLLLRGDRTVVADGYKAYITTIQTVKEALIKIATGISVFGISKTNLKSIEIPLPPTTAEQRAIATILSDMDAEIAALARRRDKTIALKQGMMQELLTGRIRLV